MTQEEKEVLLQDIYARLPYDVIVNYNDLEGADYKLSIKILSQFPEEKLKPYLRPMSSMTEEEQKEFDNFCVIDEEAWNGNGIKGFINQSAIMDNGIDWLNVHHFDHRNLIKKGLALEAPEGMYC